MARRNYALELQAAAFLPFLLVVVDSGVIGVVLKNAYKGEVSPGLLNLVVAIVTASTSAANIIGFAWVRLSLGVDKVRFVNALQLAMIALVALIAAAPRTGVGLWMILMHVMDIFWMVRPMVYANLPADQAPSGITIWLDIVAITGVFAIYAALLIRKVASGVLIPLNDPRQDEALAHRNYV